MRYVRGMRRQYRENNIFTWQRGCTRGVENNICNFGQTFGTGRLHHHVLFFEDGITQITCSTMNDVQNTIYLQVNAVPVGRNNLESRRTNTHTQNPLCDTGQTRQHNRLLPHNVVKHHIDGARRRCCSILPCHAPHLLIAELHPRVPANIAIIAYVRNVVPR